MASTLQLNRYGGNPVLSPTDLPWEAAAVCNPAALDFGGQVHLFYRAIDREGISAVGHAVSADGLSGWKRSPEPVLARDPADPYQTLGVEDPRTTWLEDRAYLTCTLASIYPSRAPKPWDAGTAWRVRVGLSSSEDLRTFTPPRVVIPRRDSKNAVLFPQKVGGRYVMFHRQYPDIWIATSADGQRWDGHRPVMRPRPGRWDGERVGSGPPPILTEHGWLLIYHGTQIHEDAGPSSENRGAGSDQQTDGLSLGGRTRRYQVGVALFNRGDPGRLIARSPEPIFEPEADYETPFTIAGLRIEVVFPTGIAERGGQYLIYYGAGDTQVGIATVPADALLDYCARLRRENPCENPS